MSFWRAPGRGQQERERTTGEGVTTSHTSDDPKDSTDSVSNVSEVIAGRLLYDCIF